MALNLNVSPYYDDFDETKNYNRILFKPGYAVQARELTQLQSALQDQIGKFGNHIFKNGVIVTGCETTLDKTFLFIKILDTDADGETVSNSTLEDYIGATLEGQTSGITAKVLGVATGLEASTPNYKTLYLRYLTGDGSVGVHFYDEETITVTVAEDETLIDNTFVVDNTIGADLSDVYFGAGLRVKVGSGVFYVNNKFVYHEEETLLISKYTSNASCKIGFTLDEEVVDTNDDETLLDPAQGSFNYAAPGADRYHASLTLVSYNSDETPDDNFYSILELVNGEIFRKIEDTTAIYANIGKNMARRTFEESGNYAVKAFPILIKEHLDTGGNGGHLPYNTPLPSMGGQATKLALGIEPGKAYVQGYECQTYATQYIAVEKGNTSVINYDIPISTSYGNYILVDELAGIWDIKNGDQVYLCTTRFDAVTGTDFSADATTVTKVGTARVRQLVYESGTMGDAAAVYRVYLYDIRLTSGTLADVVSLHSTETRTGYATYGFADFVGSTTLADLQETNYKNSIFRIPATALKTLQPTSFNNSFIYTKEFDGQLDSNGLITITLSSPESFPYATNPSATIVKNNFMMVLKEAATINSVSRKEGEYIDLTGGSVTITRNSATSFAIDVGTIAAAKYVKLYVNVMTADALPLTKEIQKDRYVKIDPATHAAGLTGPWQLGVSDVKSVKAIYVGSTYATSETDQLDQFVVNNGQAESFYGPASISLKPGSTLSLSGKFILVKMDYFTHVQGSATGSFFTVNSYPVDDTGATGIYTYEIPIYVSPTGETFDLRDCIDFRPRIADVATNASSVGSATINPVVPLTISAPTFGITNPVPTEQFITDFEYYLGRKDRVILDENGYFSVLSGIPSLNPKYPFEPETSMSLATIDIPPYPSLAPNYARAVKRTDYGVKYKTIDNRRYTMRDIGTLEQRINRLEYYTSLTLLEKAAADLTIPSSGGSDRFKNGILVDAFTGHNIGNVFDKAYHISIDPAKKELRPYFFLENKDVSFNSSASSNLVKTGDLLTLPYTQTVYTQNTSASKFRNAVSDLIFNWLGDMTLDPPADNWVDTIIRPDVQVNFDGNYDNWEQMAGSWGTQWNDWQTNWTGTTTATADILGTNVKNNNSRAYEGQYQLVTTTTEQRQTRQGVTLSVTPETQSERIGNSVVDTSLVPYMRERTVTFKATRLKPNTRLFPFFDGVLVEIYCRQLTSDVLDFTPDDSSLYEPYKTNQWGESLISDADGVICGQFKIPAGRFRVGTKNFRLADDYFNRSVRI